LFVFEVRLQLPAHFLSIAQPVSFSAQGLDIQPLFEIRFDQIHPIHSRLDDVRADLVKISVSSIAEEQLVLAIE
jgi:hypothetical protein